MAVLVVASMALSGALVGESEAATAGAPAWAWGSTLGNGSGAGGDLPVAVSTPPGVTFTAIAAGNGDDLAIDSTGQAWAWGSNVYGQLGNGTTTDSSVPVAVSMPTGVTFTAISAGDEGSGSDSLALDTTGHAWAWGFNDNGELGVGTTTGPDTCSNKPCSTEPAAVSMPPNVTFSSVSAGEGVSAAIDSTGRAWAWGSNGFGELGNGTITDSSVPVAVSMPPGVTFSEISGGGTAILALDSSGRAWGWGFNADGELGNGTITDSSVPVAVSMPSGVTFTSVTLGSFNSLALDSTGRAWSWGTNEYGVLGIGATSGPETICVFPACSTTPVTVAAPEGMTFTAISAGAVDDLALDSTGDVWGWGDNHSGQLGNGSTTGATICVRGLACSPTPLPASMPPGVTFTTVSEGNGTSLALSQSDAPMTGMAPSTPLTGSEGVPFFARPVPVSGIVATFTDADPHGTVTDYHATIAWGDGTTSTGSIGTSGNGFRVSGNHTYQEDGNYTITVHIADIGGATTTVNARAHVSEPRNFLAFLVDLFFERFGF